ncbi:unnamed protein product, partial [marine sediment metagenome]
RPEFALVSKNNKITHVAIAGLESGSMIFKNS